VQAVSSRCCGLGVHRDQVAACVLVLGKNRKRAAPIREFRTSWRELQKLMGFGRPAKTA